MDQLVHLLLADLLSFDNRGLSLDGLAHGSRESLLGLLVVFNCVVSLTSYICTHDGIRGVSFLLLSGVLLVHLQNVLLEVTDEHVPVLDHRVHLLHDLPQYSHIYF